MIDREALVAQIKRNCNISDAQYWGGYSLCGLLLRLRELYRSEHGIAPWGKLHKDDIGPWISDRESLWRELEDNTVGSLVIHGTAYDPFEVEEINRLLDGEGLLYGAGYGMHMKPSFFLADRLSEKHIDGIRVYIAGREYVRDLSDYPAMLQDHSIFTRLDMIKLHLWQKFEELRCRNTKNALVFAFSKYDISPGEELSDSLENKINSMAYSEADTYIYHEIGEAFEGEQFGDEWKDLLSEIAHTRTEIFARSAKDILADTSEHGMMHHIINNRKEGSLGFYIVFLSGFRKIVFPELADAFQEFAQSGDWGHIENARKIGYRKAREYCEKLLSIYRNQPDKSLLTESIENELLKGLV
jgi:hypothetical protein